MAAQIKIEHIGKGWIEIFKSAEMQAVVDAAGAKIAAAAGGNFEYTQAQNSQFTAAGFVVPANYEGAFEEATEKTLTKAVNG